MFAKAAVILGLVLAWQDVAAQVAGQTYESAEIDARGRLRISTSENKTIIVPKARRALRREHALMGPQTSFGEPVLSEDRRAIAAQAKFANCCTSYDIPMQIVVVYDGKIHRFEGASPVFDFHFVDGSRRIAFGVQPVHFGCEVHWELRDIATERLIAAIDVPQPCGQRPEPPPMVVPSWVGGNASDFK